MKIKEYFDPRPMSLSLNSVPLLAIFSLIIVCVVLVPASTESLSTARVLTAWVYPLLIIASVVLFHLPLIGLAHTHDARSTTAWWSLDIALCSFLVIQAIKFAVPALRPTGGLQGFPSGHTAYSFALAFLVLESYPRLGPLWFSIAVGIGWSRAALDHHFVYQVIAGALLGLVLGWLVTQLRLGLLFPRCLGLKVNSTRDKWAG